MSKTADRNYQCLMIEAEDRTYFTNEENLPQLLEFCKSFNMKMSIVKANTPPILNIADLPKAVCDAKKTPKTEVDVVKKVLPFDPVICIPLVRTRSQILETAKAVKDKIREKFTKGEAVSLDMLEEEFPDSTITNTTFMQHVRNARKELTEQGYYFERISPGCYRAVTPEQQKVQQAEKNAVTLQPPTWTKYPPPTPPTVMATHLPLQAWPNPNPIYELGTQYIKYVPLGKFTEIDVVVQNDVHNENPAAQPTPPAPVQEPPTTLAEVMAQNPKNTITALNEFLATWQGNTELN